MATDTFLSRKNKRQTGIQVGQVAPPVEQVEQTNELFEMKQYSPSIEIWDNIQNNGSLELKKWLTLFGIKANLEAKHPQYKCPLLYHASRSNNMEVIKLLLEKKANINSQESPFRSTALHIASFLGFENVTKLLLDAKANPYLRSEEHTSEL